jgi:hypothetical protein
LVFISTLCEGFGGKHFIWLEGTIANDMVVVGMSKNQENRPSTFNCIYVLFDGQYFIWKPSWIDYYNYIIGTDDRRIGLKKGALKNRNIKVSVDDSLHSLVVFPEPDGVVRHFVFCFCTVVSLFPRLLPTFVVQN